MSAHSTYAAVQRTSFFRISSAARMEMSPYMLYLQAAQDEGLAPDHAILPAQLRTDIFALARIRKAGLQNGQCTQREQPEVTAHLSGFFRGLCSPDFGTERRLCT